MFHILIQSFVLMGFENVWIEFLQSKEWDIYWRNKKRQQMNVCFMGHSKRFSLSPVKKKQYCEKICVNAPLQLVMKHSKAVGMTEAHLSSPLFGETVPFWNVMSI